MTGWHPGIEILYTCPSYAPSQGILAQVTPGVCASWWGARCELGRECRWAGQPPEKSERTGGTGPNLE